jgi:phosphatidylglycerol:prolipoprotein diacylglycerol transferase
MIEETHNIIPAYVIAIISAFAAGIAVYRHNTKDLPSHSEHLFPIILAAFFGGILGAKLPIILMNLRGGFSLEAILAGRTIVGGLVGGTLGVLFIKKKLGIRGRYGNRLAPSIALGMGIGRIGCFFSGCCFGKPTDLPWGMDFGDGIARHPTQLYEMLFCFGAFVLLQRARKTAPPGRLLTRFFLAYFTVRFLIEFIRPHEIMMGLTPFQWISIAGILILTLKTAWMKKQEMTP